MRMRSMWRHDYRGTSTVWTCLWFVAVASCGQPYGDTSSANLASAHLRRSMGAFKSQPNDTPSTVANFCTNGGVLGPSGAGQYVCLGALAKTSFVNGICACGEYRGSSNLTVDGYNSTVTGSQPGSLPAAMGVNDRFLSDSLVSISGDLTVTGTDGMRDSAAVRVAGNLYSPYGFASSDSLYVMQDAYVGVQATAYSFHVAGKFFLDPNATYGKQTGDQTVTRQTVRAPAPPCACDNVINVAGYTAAQAWDNDNEAAGLYPSAWDNQPSPIHVTLQCGRYYFDGMSVNAPVNIVATGHVALFIDGDAFVNHPWSMTTVPGAQLDVFIAGNLLSQGGFTFGNPNAPSTARLYVGGEQVAFDGPANINGDVYAANSAVSIGHDANINGALFGGSIAHVRHLLVHYDAAVGGAGSDGCQASPPPVTTPPPPPPPVVTVPPPASNCTSCADCGSLTCSSSGTCVACDNNTPCCAGRVCEAGTCVPG